MEWRLFSLVSIALSLSLLSARTDAGRYGKLSDFLAEETTRAVDPSSSWYWSAEEWSESFKEGLEELQKRIEDRRLPAGLDAIALSELNLKASRIWSSWLKENAGDLDRVRSQYLNGIPKNLKRQLSELKLSLESFLETTTFEGPAVLEAFSLPQRSLRFHPLIVQLLTEQIADFKLFIVIDKREEIFENGVLTTVSVADSPRFDNSYTHGNRELTVLSGPKRLRNAYFFLSLHLGIECEGWGIFPTANYSIIFNASNFGIGNIISLNFDLPRKVRDSYRAGVGDLRDIAGFHVARSIEKDCGRLPLYSFAYQESSQIVKKYRALWKSK